MNIGELKAQIAGLSDETLVVLQVREEVVLSQGETYVSSMYYEVEFTDYDPELAEIYIMSEVQT